MVNYYLNYTWKNTGDLVKQTETFRTYETKSTFIHFRSNTPSTLQIFSGMDKYAVYEYEKYGTDYDNISLFQKELEDIIPINTNYTKHFSNTAPFIFIRVLNSSAAATGDFSLMLANSFDKDFVSASVRDSNLKLNQLVSLTRPTTDISLDILDNNITGFSNVVVKAKGNLSSVEALLMNSDTVQGFFDNTRLLDDIYVVSDAAVDTNTAGIGARQVLINGLSTSKQSAQITTNLNGTGIVLAANTLIWVNSVQVSVAGTLGFNSGHIRVYNQNTSAANLITSIEPGEGQSFNPQYEVPSNNTLYITSMSVFGHCVDRGFIKIVKYTYTDPSISSMLYKVIDKFDVSPSMNYNRKVNFTIQDGERIAIYRKAYNTPQGNNDITIQLYGTQKLTNLDVQSTI